MPTDRAQREAAELQLARAGFPDPHEEVRILIEAASGDVGIWSDWVRRRRVGEPLEWLTGFTTFMDHRVRVDPGIYVPRPQSELIARRAIEALPSRGIAADLCTGAGAIAVALRNARTDARIVATDTDARACQCAAKNGVEVYQGHLAEPIPTELFGTFDVVVAVVPYVPSDELIYLPRDVRNYEPLAALDGGPEGLDLLAAATIASTRLLHTEGSLILELGGTQDEGVAPVLQSAGFHRVSRLVDEDGDLRGVHARFAPSPVTR